jgi:hypothetical protein
MKLTCLIFKKVVGEEAGIGASRLAMFQIADNDYKWKIKLARLMTHHS